MFGQGISGPLSFFHKEGVTFRKFHGWLTQGLYQLPPDEGV